MSNRLEEIRERWNGLEGTRGDVVYLLRRLEAAEAVIDEVWRDGPVREASPTTVTAVNAWQATKEELGG